MTDRASRYWPQRASRQGWLRWLIGAVVLVTVVGMSLTIGVAARQPDRAVRAAISAASAGDKSMVWKRLAASNWSAQDAATRAQLRRAFGNAPVTIASSLVGYSLALADGDAVLPLRDDASLRGAATGMPVLHSGEVALDDIGARALHVGVGDTIRVQTKVGTRRLSVVAVWHARDPRSPIWSGIEPRTLGSVARIVLSPGELAADQITLTARWSISPDPTRVRTTDLATIESGFAQLALAQDRSGSFAELDGGASDFLAAIRRGSDAASAVVPVAVALLAAGSLLSMLLLVRLLAEVRVEENLLLRARGASRVQIASGDVRAALIPVLVPAAIGGVLAQLSLLLLLAPPSGWAELVLPVVVPAVAALAIVVVGSSASTADRRTGQAPQVTGAAAAALLAVLAVVGAIRVLTAGVGADPSAELAPALIIAALVVVGLVLSRPIAAAADVTARRADGLLAPIATRRLRRRPGLVAGALVLVALAVASCGFAASAVPSSTDFVRDASRLVAGGDLDVQVGGVDTGSDASASDPLVPDVETIARAAHADAAVPALVEPAQLGDVTLTMAAAPTTELSGLHSTGLADVGALTSTIGRPGGIPLTGSGSLRVEVAVRSASAPSDMRVLLTAWIVRADGVIRVHLPAAAFGIDTVEGRLPAGAGGRLVAIEAAVRTSAEVQGLAVDIRSIAVADGATVNAVPLPSAPWMLTKAVPAEPGTAESGALGWAVPRVADAPGGSAELGRLMPAGPTAVPVAVSRALAATVGLQVGDRAELSAGSNVPVVVASVVPHTIGASGDSGMWADLPTLQATLLRVESDVPRADHVWLAVKDPVDAANRLGASEPAAVVSESPAVVLVPFVQAVAVGILAAAAGTLLLALLGIVAVVASLMRARRPEVVVLRAVGMGSPMQQVIARIELLGVLGYALVVGLAAAAVATAITVPALAHALAAGVAPDVDPPVKVDGFLAGIAMLVLAAAAIVGLIAQNKMIDRIASRPGTGEER
ncbi:MAG TPA: hypothetical protein VGM70_00560 [Pseudolysinimonas sp.]|jgi:hypothetical protein